MKGIKITVGLLTWNYHVPCTILGSNFHHLYPHNSEMKEVVRKLHITKDTSSKSLKTEVFIFTRINPVWFNIIIYILSNELSGSSSYKENT